MEALKIVNLLLISYMEMKLLGSWLLDIKIYTFICGKLWNFWYSLLLKHFVASK